MTSPHQISATAADAQVHQPERAPFTTWTGCEASASRPRCFFFAILPPLTHSFSFAELMLELVVFSSDNNPMFALKQRKLESVMAVVNGLNANVYLSDIEIQRSFILTPSRIIFSIFPNPNLHLVKDQPSANRSRQKGAGRGRNK